MLNLNLVGSEKKFHQNNVEQKDFPSLVKKKFYK